ncbi:MAG: tetratricopeptide repeat protein [Chloroflexi bacterium]|nr:tetratricopeptide repeat protein [Chloroflexota bacterium]
MLRRSIGRLSPGGWRSRRGLVLLSLVVVAGFFLFYYVDRYVRLAPGPAQLTIARLEERVRQAPNNLGLRVQLAEAYATQRRYDEAVSQYQAAIKLEEENPAAHLGLGNTYFTQKKYPQAKEAYQKVIDFYQDKPYRRSLRPLNDLYFNLAVMYEQEGSLEEAAASLEEALAIDRVDADALHRLGTVRLRQSRPEDAATACEQAVRFVPDFPSAYETLVSVYEQLGDRGRQLYARGMLRYSQKDYPGAVGILEQAVQALPDHEGAWVGLAMAYERNDQKEQALGAYRDAERLNADNLLIKWGIQRLSQP